MKTEDRNSKIINPYHTSFIFIDNKNEHRYGGETKFRAAFESYIKNRKIIEGKGTDETPVVLISLQGGITAMKLVTSMLMNNIPSLLIQKVQLFVNIKFHIIEIY